MKEIEVKAHLHKRELVTDALKDLGCIFEETVFQDSMDFCNIENPTQDQYLSQSFFIRLRTTGISHELSVKKPIKGETELSKIEYQTKIEDREQLQKLLEIMGFYPALQIKKERIITHYNEYEICLDEVEGLGSFIEVEKMSNDDPKIVREELQKFLFSLGIPPEDEVFYGYDTLIFKKNKK